MKAISLWEPWASLIAVGAKRFETRSWATSYRGPLLICAAKGGLPKGELFDLLADPEFREALFPGTNLELSGMYSRLKFGGAVCVVDLVAIYRTGDMTPKHIGTDEPFGDFSPGRFAWKLENVRAFKEPFPVKGKQGLFEVDDSLIIGKETVARY